MEMCFLLIISSFKNIFYKLKLILKTPIYIYSLIGVFVLLFTSTFYYEPNRNEIMTGFDFYNLLKGEINLESSDICNILLNSGNGYYSMFSQVIAALPFLIFYVSEKNTHFNIFQLTREKTCRYIIESYITCAISVFITIMIAMLVYDAVFIIAFRCVEFNLSELFIHNMLSAFSNVLSSMIQLVIVGFVYNVFSAVGLFFTINYYIYVASQKEIMADGNEWIMCLPDNMLSYFERLPLLKDKVLILVCIKVIVIIILEVFNNYRRRIIRY